jgi:hypothetical protein
MRRGDAGWRNRFSTANEPNLADMELDALWPQPIQNLVHFSAQSVRPGRPVGNVRLTGHPSLM